jgi:hypothetical protein
MVNDQLYIGAQLTEEMRAAGAEVIRALDASALDVKAALWLFSSERKNWRLMVAIPEVHTLGSRVFYRRINSILSGLEAEHPLPTTSDITVVDDQDPFIVSLRAAFADADFSNLRLSDVAIGGSFVEDAFVYRAL